MQTWSHTSQESKSFTHSSACFSSTAFGSSTMPASIRASWIPDAQSSRASWWSFPISLAIFLRFGIETPSVFSGFIPKRAMPATASGSERDLSFLMTFFDCCLLYTSDAADDLLCVDLGGRRIIKKKKKKHKKK